MSALLLRFSHASGSWELGIPLALLHQLLLPQSHDADQPTIRPQNRKGLPLPRFGQTVSPHSADQRGAEHSGAFELLLRYCGDRTGMELDCSHRTGMGSEWELEVEEEVERAREKCPVRPRLCSIRTASVCTVRTKTSPRSQPSRSCLSHSDQLGRRLSSCAKCRDPPIG